MEEKYNWKNVESEDLLKVYEKIYSFIKFLDSEKEKNQMEGENG